MTEPTAPRPQTAYARAETSARQGLLMVSIGVAALVVGKIIESQVSVSLADSMGDPPSDGAAFALTWTLGRLWLLVVLPAFAFLVARFLSISGVSFAIVGGCSGEAFKMLMDLAVGGPEFAFSSTADTIARFATLGIGIGLAALAGRKGETMAFASQERARVAAEKTKADYAAMLERAAAGTPKIEPAATAVAPATIAPPAASAASTALAAPATAASATATPATATPATAGPATAGPATAGPATAGPATAGPATAGPATAGPATAGPATAGPATAGPATAGATAQPSAPATSAAPPATMIDNAAATESASADPSNGETGKGEPPPHG